MSHRISEVKTWNNDVAIITFEYQGERHKMRCVKDGSHDHCSELDATSNMDEIVMERMANELMQNYHLFDESMKATVDITNQTYHGTEEIIVHQFSGELSDLPDDILDRLNGHHCDKLSAGDWITIIDGEVIEIGEFHPFHIHTRQDSLAHQVDTFKERYTRSENNVSFDLTEDEYEHLAEAARIIRKYQ